METTKCRRLAVIVLVAAAIVACRPGPPVDDDNDGIGNSLEVNGYTYSPVSGLLPWNGVDTPFFKTDPRRWSTDGDPYSDYMEATGINMPAGVPAPENHPLVAARPIIAVFMDGYDIIPIQTENTGSSTSTMSSSSHTTSNTNTVGGEVSVEAQTKVGGSFFGPSGEFSTKVSAKASYSHTWVSTDTDSSSATEGASQSVTVDPSRAGKLKLRLFYENVGTSAAREVVPTFTLSLGEKTIATIKPSQVAQLMNRAGRPRSRYPESGVIVVGDRPEDEIILSLEEINALRGGAVMRIDVTQVSAKMSRWDESNNSWDYDNDWVNYAEEIDEVTAPVLVRKGDSHSAQYWIYAGTEYQGSDMTLAKALALVIATQTNEAGEMIFDDLPAGQWAYAVDPGVGVASSKELLATPLERDATYLVLRPDLHPDPVIAWAEFNNDRSNLKVSVDPGDYPVASVVAVLSVNEEPISVALADDGAIAYMSPEPFAGPVKEGKVIVKDIAGNAVEAVIADHQSSR